MRLMVFLGLAGAAACTAAEGGASAAPDPGSALPMAIDVQGVLPSAEEIAFERARAELVMTGSEVSPATTQTWNNGAFRLASFPLGEFKLTDPAANMGLPGNTFAGYGQGAQGYGTRSGANFTDGSFGAMISGAKFPPLFRPDSSYFHKGAGSIPSRAMYAIANSVICKGDNGHWQPKYSAFIDGLSPGGLSNRYYRSSNRIVLEVSFAHTFIGTAKGAAQNLVQEFVPPRITSRLLR